MNCAECKELLVVHLEGLLDESGERAVQEHLGQCDTCRTELAELQTLQHRLVHNGEALARSDFEDNVMNRIIREQNVRLKAAEGTSAGLVIRRLIMKSPISKLAIAAAVIVAAAVAFQFIGGPAAYALSDTIEANHSVRYLHIKNFDSQHETEPKEFWVACNEQGQIDNARYFIPDWASSGDGAKSVAWSQGVVKVWFHKKKSFLTCRDENVQKRMLEMVQESDPRLAVEHLQEQADQGKLTLDIQQPTDKSQPIIVTAVYPPDSRSPWREVIFHVDQATKLVTTIEYYRAGADGQLVHVARQENHDYNVPIAPEMFVLDNEVPADVFRVDQVTQDVGFPQGNMTDKEAVVACVREFWEAIKAQDYARAGMMFGGIPAEKMQEWFGRMKVVGIVSIGEPTPHSNPGVGGFVVPCTIELELPDGSKVTKEFARIAVRPVDREYHPDRWNIHGGI